jgi:hypothetical protein
VSVRRALSLTLAGALFACARSSHAADDGEVTVRVPVGVSIQNGARFELGLHSDLTWFPRGGDFGVGLAGGVSELGWFDTRRKQVGLAVLDTPDVGREIRMGLGFEGGLGSDPAGRFVFGRASYQLRVGVLGDRFAYACSSTVFIEARGLTGDRSGFGMSVGVELGGGFLLTALYLLTTWVHD